MAKAPTKKQRERWGQLAALGCMISTSQCAGRITIHHCGTGGGGRKNHDKVIPLCYEHHLGKLGIDGKHIGKKHWQQIYGTEEFLMEKLKELEEA